MTNDWISHRIKSDVRPPLCPQPHTSWPSEAPQRPIKHDEFLPLLCCGRLNLCPPEYASTRTGTNMNVNVSMSEYIKEMLPVGLSGTELCKRYLANVIQSYHYIKTIK